MMSGIRGQNTKPEVLIRKALFARGFRYRLHDRALPGRPDLVFPRYRAVIQVNGCFWHRHGCHSFKWPTTRIGFWRNKLNRNHANDNTNRVRLIRSGWRVLTIWECAIRGPGRFELEAVTNRSESFLSSTSASLHIEGKPRRK